MGAGALWLHHIPWKNAFCPVCVGHPGSFACFGIPKVTWAACKGWFKSNGWGVQKEGKWVFFIPCVAEEEGGRAEWRDRENSGELSFKTELKFPEYNILINSCVRCLLWAAAHICLHPFGSHIPSTLPQCLAVSSWCSKNYGPHRHFSLLIPAFQAS